MNEYEKFKYRLKDSLLTGINEEDNCCLDD